MIPAVVLVALLGAGHPIHSSSALVSFPAGTGRASIVVRVFADDFPPGRAVAPAGRYLAERFTLSDVRRSKVPLQLHDIAPDGVVLVLTLSAPAAGLSGGLIWHGVLAERFPDQVNLVRVQRDGRTTSILFTASDGPKALP